MAHFAEVDANNIVLRVIVVPDEIEALGEAAAARWIAEPLSSKGGGLGLGGRWVQTSYTGSMRSRFAGVGFEWRPEADAFVRPKPEAHWIFDEQTKSYRPPSRDLGAK